MVVSSWIIVRESCALGKHVEAPEADMEPGDNQVWVVWYVRKSMAHSWGEGTVQFIEHIGRLRQLSPPYGQLN